MRGAVTELWDERTEEWSRDPRMSWAWSPGGETRVDHFDLSSGRGPPADGCMRAIMSAVYAE